jgi:hypothetical protein
VHQQLGHDGVVVVFDREMAVGAHLRLARQAAVHVALPQFGIARRAAAHGMRNIRAERDAA